MKTALKESEKLIGKLYELYNEHGVPAEQIALDCKTSTGSVYRWFGAYKKGQVKEIQRGIRYFVDLFVKKYYTDNGDFKKVS